MRSKNRMRPGRYQRDNWAIFGAGTIWGEFCYFMSRQQWLKASKPLDKPKPPKPERLL